MKVDDEGKIEITEWTPDAIATHIAMSDPCSIADLCCLGLLLQGGAVVTLPPNYAFVPPNV